MARTDRRLAVRRGSRRGGAARGALAACLAALALLLAAPPAAAVAAPNDAFASPQVLPGKRIEVIGTTRDATREADEPDHCATASCGESFEWIGDHTVWYRWKAPASGRVTIHTCAGTFIDSILAVYTGDQLASLTRVAESNNDCVGTNNFGSKVVFRAKQGKIYQIVVGDAGGAREEPFTLSLQLKA